MKVGDLVRNIYTKDIGLITRADDVCKRNDYVEVDWKWRVPDDHLEVISESR